MMMCDTCTNRTYCENEERQMCIANDYDRYDDDGSLELDLDDTEYDTEIDTVKMVFNLMVCESKDTGVRTLSNCCTAINSLVDWELGDLLFRNLLRCAGTCI